MIGRKGLHRSGGKFTIALMGIMALSAAHGVRAASLDVEKVLNLIDNTAERICYTASTTGDANTSGVKGEVKAQLSGLASKLFDVGISGSGSINNEHYQNVLRQDLAITLKHGAECRFKVFDRLQVKLLSPEPSPASPSSVQPSVPVISSLEQQAIQFAYSFILRESLSVPEMARFVTNNYATTVLYFNHGYFGHAEIINDKRAYMQRWPIRSYTILPGITAKCTESNECIVDGRIKYHVQGPNRESCGSASFTLGLDFIANPPVITREQGQSERGACS